MTVIPVMYNVLKQPDTLERSCSICFDFEIVSDHYGILYIKELSTANFLYDCLFHHIHDFFVVKALKICSFFPALFL